MPHLAGRAGGGPRGHAAPGAQEASSGVGHGGGGPTWVSRGGSLATGPVRGEANDYSQHFVDTGLRPQNNLRDVHLVRPSSLGRLNGVCLCLFWGLSYLLDACAAACATMQQAQPARPGNRAAPPTASCGMCTGPPSPCELTSQ